MPRSKRERVSNQVHANAVIELSVQEASTLVALATYYQSSMGPFRYLVRLTAQPDVKTKYRFMAEESALLKRFAETVRDEHYGESDESKPITFTPAALVAFWGRVLSSLESRRSRRKLSADEVAAREALASKFEEAGRALYVTRPQVLEAQLETRRPTEANWMRERLTTG